MRKSLFIKIKSTLTSAYFRFFMILVLAFVLFFAVPELFSIKMFNVEKNDTTKSEKILTPIVPPLDKIAYDRKLNELANNPPDPIVYETVKTVETNKTGKSVTKTIKVPFSPQPVKTHLWPVKTVYPKDGAILPFSRIVAYYGNLYSKKMGVLGEYPEDKMLQKLEVEIKKWQKADPETSVIPALHYIAVVAQDNAGEDGKYRARMPYSEIDKIIKMAERINALVFLDIQVGLSNLETEVPLLGKYLKMPQVHLGVDPEFSMKTGIKPGKIVGTSDANDINWTTNYLAEIVKENDLIPKILVVHRYTQKMVTNYKEIKLLPEVQIVIIKSVKDVKRFLLNDKVLKRIRQLTLELYLCKE